MAIQEQLKTIQRTILSNELTHRRLGINAPTVTVIPAGDYGQSNSPYTDWSKETRRFVFNESNFREEVIYLLIFSENDVEEFEGSIDWNSEINIGRLLIEILLTVIITGIIFIFSRFK